MKKKVIRITTVPIYMNIVLKGQLNYLSNTFEVIGITGYDEKHFNEIRDREGVKMYQVDMVRTINIKRDIISLLRLIKIFKIERPDIIHTHTPKAGLLGMIAGYICGVPIRLHTVTGLPLLETKGVKKLLLLTIERVTYFLATKVYPNSYGLKEIIRSYHLSSDKKLNVLLKGSTNGVDTRFFNPELLDKKEQIRSSYGISKNAFVFLFVGRIAKEKGIVELIEALERINELYQEKYDIKLVMVGKFEKNYGNLDAIHENYLETSPYVKLLGRFDDVRPFYKMADVFVLPSYREGFPNSLLEATSMKIPSIVTDINGCNEIIENGINGLIIPTKNSQALFQAMEKLLCNNHFRNKLADNTRNSIVLSFDRQIMLNSLLNEYQNQINDTKNQKFC